MQCGYKNRNGQFRRIQELMQKSNQDSALELSRFAVTPLWYLR